MRRRSWLVAGAGLGASLVGARLLLPTLLRAPQVRPLAELSPEARALIQRSLEGLDPALLLDCHVHVVGIGDGGTGCEVNPEMRSQLHPIRRIQYEAYLAASGLDESGSVDADYLARVKAQTAEFPRGARFAMLAFDWCHDERGLPRPERSSFHVPNDYVAHICKAEPGWTFFASVHPYRADALHELERVHALGATGIKWLPNAMNIDPLDPRTDAFYEKLHQLDLVLLTHAGHELAVHGDEGQALGNPLRLRKPLEHGVKVIVAHAASYGPAADLDHAPSTERSAFELFLRLMGEARYEGKLFGELSATTLRNRGPGVTRALLERTELHGRLVNGSDYPVIAVDPLISLRSFAGAGLLAEEDLPALRELFSANPVLWDLVLKRSFRVLTRNAPLCFAPQVFQGGRLLRSV